MSVIKINITDEHLKLIKYLNWSLDLNDKNQITTDGCNSPFGGDDIYDDIGVIIYGKRDIDEETFKYKWTDEEKEHMNKLIDDLPKVVEIILHNHNIDKGLYKTKFNFRNWKKVNSK